MSVLAPIQHSGGFTEFLGGHWLAAHLVIFANFTEILNASDLSLISSTD